MPARPILRTVLGLFTVMMLTGACSTRPHDGRGTASVAAATTTTVRPPSRPRPSSAVAPWADPATATGSALLAPGSRPAALPAAVLIADRGNNRLVVVDPQGRMRWVFPRPGDLAPGQTFLVPDDAFLTPDGRYIIATEEDDFVIRVISVATHRIIYSYGTPGRHGASPNKLWNPDDALMLPDGYIVTADIKNCRLLLIAPGAHTPSRVFGHARRPCRHDPPAEFGSPNGAFPMRNGHYLVTEINGDWVDEMDLIGHVSWSAHPPGVAYPSDTNEIAPGRYLTVAYSHPGQVVIFNRAGHTIWRYAPTGRAALDHPSLALPLPNGGILLNDDRNHRVIVVDPHTNRVIWQYGHAGVPGHAPGYLDNPDGVDLVPPHSLLITHASTIGQPR